MGRLGRSVDQSLIVDADRQSRKLSHQSMDHNRRFQEALSSKPQENPVGYLQNIQLHRIGFRETLPILDVAGYCLLEHCWRWLYTGWH
jgi:hypothetical protein